MVDPRVKYSVRVQRKVVKAILTSGNIPVNTSPNYQVDHPHHHHHHHHPAQLPGGGGGQSDPCERAGEGEGVLGEVHGDRSWQDSLGCDLVPAQEGGRPGENLLDHLQRLLVLLSRGFHERPRRPLHERVVRICLGGVDDKSRSVSVGLGAAGAVDASGQGDHSNQAMKAIIGNVGNHRK